MANINHSLIDELVEIIYKRIEEKFQRNLNSANIEYTAEGVIRASVVDASGNTVNSTTDDKGNITTYANVELPFNTLTNVLNKTGETLADGDRVKIFYNNTDMSGVYIGVKF